MPTPDVRVRLSAEGVAEVVGALQKIQAQAGLTARTGASQFMALNGALMTVRRTLAALGVALSIGTFSAIVAGASDAAESTLNLSQAIGASVEGTRQLGAAAKRTGTDLSSIAQSIGQFAAKTQAALRGDPAALGLFRQAGLTRAEIEKFQSLDTAGRLELTARAFARLEDSAGKTELGIALFGRKFKELIPLVNEIGSNGLPKLQVQLKEGTLQAAAALGDELDDMKTTVRDLSIQFVGGLAPSVTTALRSVRGDLADNAAAWEIWGGKVGKVIAGIVLSVANLVDSIGGALEIAMVDLRALGEIAQAVASKNTFLIGAIVATAREEERLIQEAQRRRAETRFEAFQSIGKPTPFGPQPDPGWRGGAPVSEPDDTLERAADLRRAQIDRELKQFQASQKLRQEIEERSFSEGLLGLREFYDRRREIVVAGVNAEIVALQKRRLVAEQDPGLKNRAAEIEKIDSQIEQLVLGRAAQIEELNAKEAEEYRRLANERLELDRKIFEARGDQHTAALIQIEEEVEKADLLLAKMGVSAEEAERTLAALRSSLNAQAEFNLLSRAAGQALGELDQDRAKIQAQVDAGLMAQAEGEARILALEQERIQSLRELGEALLRVARDSENPQLLAEAQGLLQSVEQLELALRRVEDVGAGVKAVLIDQLGASFVRTFGEGEVAALRFGSVFKSMLLDAANALRRFVTQLLFTRAIMAIFGGSGGAKVGVPGGLGDVSGPVIGATGGLVSGPGTGSSDSIPARLSDGEYIVRAAAVARPGVLRALEALNRGPAVLSSRISPAPARFAEGGLVSSSTGGAPGQAWIRMGMQRGFFAELIRSPEGRQAILEVVEENPRAFGSILGTR